MENKVFKKSIRYLIVSTLLIMAFTRGNVCDWLLIGNGAIWLVVEFIVLAKHFAKRDGVTGEEEENTDEDDTPDDLPEDTEAQDAENWYKFMGREMLTDVITELNTRGIKRLEIDEDGEIHISDTETEVIEDFPQRSVWDVITAELKADGLDASIDNEHLVIAW